MTEKVDLIQRFYKSKWGSVLILATLVGGAVWLRDWQSQQRMDERIEKGEIFTLECKIGDEWLLGEGRFSREGEFLKELNSTMPQGEYVFFNTDSSRKEHIISADKCNFIDDLNNYEDEEEPWF